MGGVYGSRSQWVGPTSEGVIQEMATVTRWDGDPSTLDDWEERYDCWREGYNRCLDERERTDWLLCTIKNEQTRERHAKTRHRQQFTFGELYQDITGRKIRNVHEPGARFRRRHIPAQPLVAVTWAHFMSDWSEEGAEVTDGMTNRQATNALSVLLQQHCGECPEDVCARRAHQKIWDKQSENANEHHYLEVHLIVLRMLLQEEYAKTSERFLLEAQGISKQVRAMQLRPDFRPGTNLRRLGSNCARSGSNGRSGSQARLSSSPSARDGHQRRSGSGGRRDHNQERSGSGGRRDHDQYHQRSNTPGGTRMEGRPRSDSLSSYRQRAEEKRRLVSSSGTCHTCGKPGHLARDCRMSTCAICGRQGHTAPYC